MTTVTVKFVKEKPDSKWWSIKTPDEKWYSYDHNKVTLATGKTYEVETTSTEKDGRTYYTITSAKEASSGSGNGAAPSGDRWWMPFVSNVVAHAIQAAEITEPSMIKAWAAAAKQAALEIESVKPTREPGEDDDPFDR